jgi:uncharacterized protein YjiS (DUF1127 family)
MATLTTRRFGTVRTPGLSWKNPLGLLAQFHEARRQRRALLALDDTLLKDIGLSRADAAREAARPFWDIERQPR